MANLGTSDVVFVAIITGAISQLGHSRESSSKMVSGFGLKLEMVSGGELEDADAGGL